MAASPIGNNSTTPTATSSLALLLAIDAHLTKVKDGANALLAKKQYKAAMDAYGRDGVEWFDSLRERAMALAAKGGEAGDEEEGGAADEVDDEGAELASKVLFYFKNTFCPPFKPAGFIFSTDDPLVRALVTVVAEDTHGMFTLATCTKSLAVVRPSGSGGVERNSGDGIAGGVGPSILLTLMALRSNKAMAALKHCEWERMPLETSMSATTIAAVAADTNIAGTSTGNGDESAAAAAKDSERVIAAVVASGLVGALSAAVAETEETATLCEKTALYARSVLLELDAAAQEKLKIAKNKNKKESTTAEGVSSPPSPYALSLYATLSTVFIQGLALSMKATSRAAKMLAMLGDAEELQLLAYFGGAPSIAANCGSGGSSSGVDSNRDLVSRAAVASAKRRYQFLLKAWQRVREAAAAVQTHIDGLPKKLLVAVSKRAVASSKGGDDDNSGGADEDSGSDAVIDTLIDADLSPLLNALAYLKNTDEAKYRLLVCGSFVTAAGGASTSSSAFARHLSPSVAPFISKVHGIGIMSTAPIEDGDVLLHESPIVKVTGGSFEERFASAVSQLKGIVVKCRRELDAWWVKVMAAVAVPASADAADSINTRVIVAKHVLPSLSNAFCSDNGGGGVAPLLLPASFYTLLAVLALHCDLQKDAALFDSGDDDQSALAVEDLALCSVWHNNAMRIADLDFSVGTGVSAAAAHTDGDGNDGRDASGLFLVGSRLNHSIRRINAVCIFDMASCQLKVRALARIPAGKEIFISYAPLIESFINQKRHLRFDVVRELQRRPVYNTEDGSAPDGKAAVDPTLLEEENETGEDVLAPHLFGQELIICPQCKTGIEGKRTDPAVTTIACNVCGLAIPVASYYASVQERREAAVALCNGPGATPADRAKAVRMLIGIEDGATMLDRHHYLRSQIRMEALAAGVGAQLSEDLSARLVHLARLTAERINGLCPPAWPLTTGLKMHYVYAMGRHRIGIQATEQNDFVGLVARAAKEDPNRISVKFEDEAPVAYSPDLIKESVDYVNRRLLRFIFLAMQDHVVQHGPEGAMTSFMARYRAELESVGIRDAAELEKAVKMAALIVCR